MVCRSPSSLLEPPLITLFRCGHCKRLKPTWDSLGDHYAAIKDKIIIAKMEATENDLPASVPFKIQGFPTLKFKKAGTREFIDYEGDRSLESFISYLEEHAANKLDVPAPAATSAEEEPAAAPTPEGQEPLKAAPKAEAEEKDSHHDEL